LSASSTPTTIRIVVVFPAPFDPNEPEHLPGSTVNDS